jgi:hypothetical protein
VRNARAVATCRGDAGRDAHHRVVFRVVHDAPGQVAVNLMCETKAEM